MRGPLLFVLFVLLCATAFWSGVYVLLREPHQEKIPPEPTQYERFERTDDGRTDKVLLYHYGLTREALPKGTVNGGCAVAPNSPRYKCDHCTTRFGVTGSPK